MNVQLYQSLNPLQNKPEMIYDKTFVWQTLEDIKNTVIWKKKNDKTDLKALLVMKYNIKRFKNS